MLDQGNEPVLDLKEDFSAGFDVLAEGSIGDNGEGLAAVRYALVCSLSSYEEELTGQAG